jgi:hypothetical protein
MSNLRTPSLFRMVAVCLAALAAVVSPAAAQTAGAGKWEIEFHSGGMSPTNPTTGSVGLPAPGQVFATAAIFPTAPGVLVVSSSRRESSWYFGDGALLFNQTASTLATSATTVPFSGRIVTLDPVIGRSLGEVRRGGVVGLRVSRVLTPRLGAELSVDYSLARVQMTQANVDSIEATRASFIAGFSGLIGFTPTRVLQSLTSTAALNSGGGHQLFASGALIINLRTTGHVIPYATVGASLISTIGKIPSATLEGNYQFLNPAGSPIDETDRVTVRDARDGRTVAGILGGGVKYHVSPRWGIRLDARVSLSKNAASTTLDATPNVALGRLPAGRAVLFADPTIVFSNNSSDPVTAGGVTAVEASTLTGPAMSGVRTFSGTGVSSDTNVTAGLFWRF